MANPDSRKPMTISREELHRRVWETPMSRLAAEFGISGNGLAKICDRLSIPYPPRGYWARKEAGQKVATFRLPARTVDTPDKVTITPTPPPAELAPSVQQALTDAKAKAAGLTVPDDLKRPHSVIAGWLADHRERKRLARLDRNPYGVAISDWSDSERRQHRILDTIFGAVESNGLVVKSDRRSAFHFEYKGEKIQCRLREKCRQVRKPKTADQSRWSSPGDKTWTQVLESTGNLVFTLEDYFGPENAIRREWLETENKRLEGMVEDIVATLLLAGPALVKMREEREEESRRRQEAERIRQQEETRRRKNRNQWRAFIEQADNHENARRARALIEALQQLEADPAAVVGERTLAQWLSWARDQANAIDPLTRGTDALFAEIAKVTDWTYRD